MDFYYSARSFIAVSELSVSYTHLDLISKIESTSRLVNIDKKIVKELEEKQDSLNQKIESLDAKDVYKRQR